MPLEYKTLKFPNTGRGLKDKDAAMSRMGMAGWRIQSESIVPGHIKGFSACCNASICLPMGFMADRTSGEIVVTLVRDSTVSPGVALEGSRRLCPKCGAQNAGDNAFCTNCGLHISVVPLDPEQQESQDMKTGVIAFCFIVVVVIVIVMLRGCGS